MDQLSVNKHERGKWTVISVSGEVDVYTAPNLRSAIVDQLNVKEKPFIALDLEKVSFLDSTGLGVLVGALKRIRSSEGELALIIEQEKLLKIFRITGLTKVFLILASLSELDKL